MPTAELPTKDWNLGNKNLPELLAQVRPSIVLQTAPRYTVNSIQYTPSSLLRQVTTLHEIIEDMVRYGWEITYQGEKPHFWGKPDQ